MVSIRIVVYVAGGMLSPATSHNALNLKPLVSASGADKQRRQTLYKRITKQTRGHAAFNKGLSV